MQSAVLDTIDSVCLSHAGIMSKQLKIRLWGLHWRIAFDTSFLMVNFTVKFKREHRERWRRPNDRGVAKIGNFSQ